MYFDANARPSATPAALHHRSDVARAHGRLQRAHDAVESHRARGEQRRVWRGEHEPGRHEGHERERDGRAHRGRAASQPRRDARRRRAMPRAPASTGKKRTASGLPSREQRAGANEHRDHRRVIEVAAGEATRPLPVVGLVGKEGEPRGEQQPHERGERGHHRAASRPALALRASVASIRRSSRRRRRSTFRRESRRKASPQPSHDTRSSMREGAQHAPRDERRRERAARSPISVSAT